MCVLVVKRLSPTAKLPTYGSTGAIGLDLYADEQDRKGYRDIHPHTRCLISTGIAVAIPQGYYGRIAPRSGLSLKNGIDVMAGVIDSDYRGEVFVMLHNTDRFETFRVEPGMRIGQLILERADRASVVEVQALPPSERGENGFGSTGM